MQSYDTALPLSISDQDLTEIDEQDLAVRQGKDSDFKSYHEIERTLERQSPFSPMTISLVVAEAARLMTQLLKSRYQARDSLFNPTFASPQIPRKQSFGSRSDRLQWISRLEYRYKTVYGHSEMEATHPMQYLVAEMIDLIILKAKFVHKLIEWRESANRMGISSVDDLKEE
jgi:hypothetical protein